MTVVAAETVLQTIDAQRRFLAEQEARLVASGQQRAAERRALAGQLAEAVRDLGQALLPTLDASSIARAAEIVGLVGLPSEDIPGKLEARRRWLVARLAEIAADTRYAQGELLRHPRTGSLVRAIAEMEEFAAAPRVIVSTCESFPRFLTLVEHGVGTPDERAAWWRVSYWADRSTAKEMLLLFPEKGTFEEVRRDYEASKETLQTLNEELARLRSEVSEGEALEQEYRRLYEEHRALDRQGLEHTRGRIVSHLLTSDAGLVSRRLESTPALRLLFLRASGMSAKERYLTDIERSAVDDFQKTLATERQRLDAIEARTRRRFAPMPVDKYQKLAEDRRPRFEKRWQRYDKVYVTVDSFDSWDRGQRFDDLLWWDLMTRGRYDGSYIYEVGEFHAAHPEYQFDADDLKGSDADFFGGEAPWSREGESAADADAAAAGVEADASPTGDDPFTVDAS